MGGVWWELGECFMFFVSCCLKLVGFVWVECRVGFLGCVYGVCLESDGFGYCVGDGGKGIIRLICG